jgi:hypothetical protein
MMIDSFNLMWQNLYCPTFLGWKLNSVAYPHSTSVFMELLPFHGAVFVMYGLGDTLHTGMHILVFDLRHAWLQGSSYHDIIQVFLVILLQNRLDYKACKKICRTRQLWGEWQDSQGWAPGRAEINSSMSVLALVSIGYWKCFPSGKAVGAWCYLLSPSGARC